MRRGRVRVGLVEGVGQAHALNRLLRDAVNHDRRRNAGDLQHCRHDVDHMVELPADAALVSDMAGQEIAMPWRVPPKNEGTCLVHLYGVSNAQAQGTAIVVVGILRAPDVVELHLLGGRQFDTVELQHLARRAVRRAFGGGAIVAADVDDQRVIQLAHVLDRLDYPTDLVVGVGKKGCIDVGLSDVELLLFVVERVPELQKLVRPGRQLGVLRDHAELLLVGEDLVAQRVPALVEQVHVGDLLHPLRRRMVRRVGPAGDVIQEERHRADRCRSTGSSSGWRHRPSRWSGSISGLPDIRVDRRCVAEQVRLPLAGVAADEAVEIFKAHAGRPLVEWTRLARRPGRRVMVLAEPRCPVAVLQQNAADRGVVAR